MSESAKQLSNQRVSAIKLNSSGPIHALAVVQMDSTGGIVSGGAGGGSTQVSVRDILTSSGASVMDGVNNAINVNVVAGAAAGSTYVSVRQSTAADLNAAVVQGSTVWQVQISTVQGIVTARPMSTLWASSAGFHFDSSGGLLTNPGAGGSTQVTVSQVLDSSGGGVVVGDSANSAIRVNVVAGAGSGGTALADQAAFSSGATSLTPVGGMVGAGDVVAGKAGVFRMSSNRALYTFAVDSSGGVIADSTQRALRVTSVDAPSTGPIVVSSITGVSIVRPEAGSTWSVRPLQSSAADLQVTATPAAGSTWNVRPLQSSAADLQMTATPLAGSTWNVRPLQSSQADLRATVYQSTASDFNATVRLNTSSGAGVEGSTTTLSTGSVLGLNIREVMPSGRQSTTLVITSTASTALYTLVSSVAGLKHCVTAYFVGSTHTVPSTLVFWSSNAIDRWAVNFGSGSSGITGANLAVAAPDWLFQTDVANALRVSIEGGSSGNSTVIARVSIKWFTEA